MSEQPQLPKLPPAKKVTAPHSLSTKKKALRLVAKGELRAHVARKLGIDPKTLRQWIADAESGKQPGMRRTAADVVQPMDEAPEALVLARRPEETIAEMMARSIPVGTPEGVYRNMVAQKLMTALEGGGAIPVPVKISEWKTLIGLMNQLMGVTAGPGRPAKNPQGPKSGPNITIKLENLSSGPRLADVIVDAEEVDRDEDDEEENDD